MRRGRISSLKVEIRIIDVRLFAFPSAGEAREGERERERERGAGSIKMLQERAGACKISIALRVNAPRPERDGYITVDGYHGNCPPARFPRSLHPPGLYFKACMYDKSKCIGALSHAEKEIRLRERSYRKFYPVLAVFAKYKKEKDVIKRENSP